MRAIALIAVITPGKHSRVELQIRAILLKACALREILT
jgi:hypothetical protein